MSRLLKYPEDMSIVIDDIKKYVPEILQERVKENLIEMWEAGVYVAIWDDSFGKEVGLEGRVTWTWNDNWDIVDEDGDD